MLRNKKFKIFFLVCTLILATVQLIPLTEVSASPAEGATVDTSTTVQAGIYAFQRNSFYAKGLFWVFYSDGINIGWEFSADGTIWTDAFTSIGAGTSGQHFSIWFDDTYIHYVRWDAPNFDILYRRGIPVNDGTITWSGAEQTVDNGVAGDNYQFPSIAVDSAGYAWIGAIEDKPGSDFLPVIIKNANNDGTWALDFATELNAVSDGSWRVVPVPLTDEKIYVVYSRGSQPLLGKLYDGGWGGQEATVTDYAVENSFQFSVVAIEDNVHHVYTRDATSQIRHNERVWGVGWKVDDVLVQDSVPASTVPVLSADPSTGNLYCFWALSTTDHVYYKQYVAGWDDVVTDWIDETVDDIQVDYLLNCFYMDYGNHFGLLYVTKLGSPYNVRFALLIEVEEPEPVLSNQYPVWFPLVFRLLGILAPFVWMGYEFTNIKDFKSGLKAVAVTFVGFILFIVMWYIAGGLEEVIMQYD